MEHGMTPRTQNMDENTDFKGYVLLRIQREGGCAGNLANFWQKIWVSEK